MSDFILDLSGNKRVRGVMKTLGLRVPLPPVLQRATGAWEKRPLQGQDVVLGAFDGGSLGSVVADTVTAAGATVREGDDVSAHALVFDTTGVQTPADLRALYDFFHPLVGRLRASGRVVVVGRPPDATDSALVASARAALEGFARSVAKELGRKGGTAHVVYVEDGADARLPGVLLFLLSKRSAFVSGQPFRVDSRTRDFGDADVRVQSLAGKVALVTGAARGIGEATARLLAAEGAHVVVLDRPEDERAASALAGELNGTALLVDITHESAPERIVSELRERFGGVDIVVHNAGVTRDKTLARMKPEAWELAIDVNLAAVARITDALLDGVLRDGGRIVCLSSVAGLAGNVGQTNYAASKAGVAGYVRALAGQVADRGITVNAIAPGFIETRMTAAIPLMIREGGRRLSSLSQGGQPRDVGDAVTFLATPGAQGLTGQVIRVCGGALIGA